MVVVPADRRIKTVDMYRLIFHFFNVLNLTLGIVVFGVAVSLLLAGSIPLQMTNKRQILVIYWMLLIASVISISMGGVGIHGCYWVKSYGLKAYIVAVVMASILELTIGVLAILYRQPAINAVEKSVSDFENALSMVNSTFVDEYRELIGNNTSTKEVTSQIRYELYTNNRTYRALVDQIHNTMSCCSFNTTMKDEHKDNFNEITSCFENSFKLLIGAAHRPCREAFSQYIAVKLLYIKLLAFLQVPVQLFCLWFDVLVLKTSQVTRDYEKLEREMSISRSQKRKTRERLENIRLARQGSMSFLEQMTNVRFSPSSFKLKRKNQSGQDSRKSSSQKSSPSRSPKSGFRRTFAKTSPRTPRSPVPSRSRPKESPSPQKTIPKKGETSKKQVTIDLKRKSKT